MVQRPLLFLAAAQTMSEQLRSTEDQLIQQHSHWQGMSDKVRLGAVALLCPAGCPD